MIDVKPHADKKIIVDEATRILKEHEITPLLNAGDEISEYFLNGFMAFKVLDAPELDKKKKKPEKPPIDYGARIANVAKRLGLSYILLDAEYRRDIKDGGASYIANYLKQIKQKNEQVIIESVLKPSFNKKFLPLLLQSKVDVLSFELVADKDMKKSLKKLAELISRTRKLSKDIPIRTIITITKKTKMVEITNALRILRKAGAEMAVIRASDDCEHNSNIFEIFEREGYILGYKHVVSKPIVKTAYDFPEFISSIY